MRVWIVDNYALHDSEYCCVSDISDSSGVQQQSEP